MNFHLSRKRSDSFSPIQFAIPILKNKTICSFSKIVPGKPWQTESQTGFYEVCGNEITITQGIVSFTKKLPETSPQTEKQITFSLLQ